MADITIIYPDLNDGSLLAVRRPGVLMTRSHDGGYVPTLKHDGQFKYQCHDSILVSQ